jgi:uncharacterized phage protein gp47/JayE
MNKHGVTDTGFVRRFARDIIADLSNAQRAALGPSLNTSADSVLGHINAVFGAAIAEVWELAEAVYSGQFVQTATGTILDDRVMMTAGITRLQPRPSSVHLVFEFDGTAPVRIAPGLLASTPGGVKVRTVEPAISKHDSPYSEPVLAEAVEIGPQQINADELTVIDTPHAHLLSVRNPLPAVLGRHRETDAELRTRHLQLLRLSGGATREAIRARVLSVAGVSDAAVQSDTRGALRVTVHGGRDQDVARALFDTLAAGIETLGESTEEVTDSTGTRHVLRFARPRSALLRLAYTLELAASADVQTVRQLVTEHIAAAIARLELGKTLRYLQLYSLPLTVGGVLDVTAFSLSVDGTVLEHNVELPADTLPVLEEVTIRA